MNLLRPPTLYPLQETDVTTSLTRETSRRRSQLWLPLIGAMVMLVWLVHAVAGCHQPRSTFGFSQHKSVELAHTLRIEWREQGRYSRIENKPDQAATHQSQSTHDDWLGTVDFQAIKVAGKLPFGTFGLPAIRAPPTHFPSA